MRTFYLLLATICCFSCSHDNRIVNVYKTNSFVLIDTIFKATEFLKYDEHEYRFHIYYNGPEKDSIRIGRSYEKFRTPLDRHFQPATKNYIGKLTLYIDTAVATTVTHEYINLEGDILDDSSKHYAAYLLLIKNTSDSTVFITARFSLIYLNREIKNQAGNWIRPDSAIHKDAICSTNEPRVYLQPNGLLISKVLRYKGNALADCRFVLDDGEGNPIVYSNTFKDSVDVRLLNR